MSVEVQHLVLGGQVMNTGKGKIHGMKQGFIAITPANLRYMIQTPSDTSSGSHLGKRVHAPITIIKGVDGPSPGLFGALCNSMNTVFPTVKIPFVITNSQGETQPYFTITLTDAALVGYEQKPVRHHHKGGRDTDEVVEISLTFQKIDITHHSGKKSWIDDWSAGG